MRLTIVTMLIAIAGFSGFADQQPPKEFAEAFPDRVEWLPNPTVPGSFYAILVGDPNRPGPLVVRVRLPANVTIAPHSHPDARTYTVLTGEWRLGFGDRFDRSRLRSYSAGSMYRLPSDAPHFQATGNAETIVQIESIGPTRTDFIKR